MPSFQNSIQSKLPHVGTTIFTIMSALAQQYNAINLAQGFPDFQCDTYLINLVEKFMSLGYNQYAPMPGLPILREIIAEKIYTLYKANYNPDTEITIMPGGTIGIYASISALVHKNEEVIIIEPCYDSYIPAISMSFGIPVICQYNYPEFTINWDEIANKITVNTKMIIINTPNNPTGTVFSREDMLQLEKLTRNTGIIILSDEVYEHIIFDQKRHYSVAMFPELINRSVIISSFGKTFHTTGWKMGYITAPSELMSEIRKVYQFMQFSAHTPTQYALSEYLSNPLKYLEIASFYEKKRNYFTHLMKETPFNLYNCEGSYFQCASYENISQLPDKIFCVELVKQAGVAAIPVSSFYSTAKEINIIRFCFAKKNETLEKAVEKLQNINLS